ncbi:hypothetical protein EVAR_49934_1 [Eumeta japonica]|uniref:Uncharacterized protein n=1 Tax=Eumeta variegata TaxID=151549 RepID=A0A4C1XXE8_EUMVA|nr:hypothetical protein EVAR_49934_1 [Eumeta japonica]
MISILTCIPIQSPALANDANKKYAFASPGASRPSGGVVSSLYEQKITNINASILAAPPDGGAHIDYSENCAFPLNLPLNLILLYVIYKNIDLDQQVFMWSSKAMLW